MRYARWLPLWLIAACHARSANLTATAVLDGADSKVDWYWPESTEPAPLVVVAHGFARSRHRMRGWGEQLSEQGFTVAVPDLPYFSAHSNNARAVVELVALAQATHPDRVDSERLALVGFSAGGLVTAVAAESIPALDLWIGLDPVDSNQRAVTAARRLEVPGVVLFAEPDACNAAGNGRGIPATWAGPMWSATVRDATHCDPERPSNASCSAFCGAADSTRSDAFVHYANAALAAVFRCDAEAIAVLDLGGSDARIHGRYDLDWVASVRERCGHPEIAEKPPHK